MAASGRWSASSTPRRYAPEPDLGDVARLDALDAGGLHLLPGRRQRAVEIDAARGILDHVGGEAELARIERRPGDAEVGGEPGHEHRGDAALLEIAREPGHGLAVGLDEGRIAVDVLVEALADDQRRRGQLEILVQGRIIGALHAVIGPQHLRAIGHRRGLERLLAGVGAGERGMARRMPVLGHDDVLERGSVPPSTKQFCTSTTISADLASGLMVPAARTGRAPSPAAVTPAAATEPRNR